MHKQALVEKLISLDPGGSLTLDEGELEQAFGAHHFTPELEAQLEALAQQHGCSFSRVEHGGGRAEFVKNDIY